MAKGEQDGLGDELFGTRLGELRDASGPTKGVFVPPPDVSDKEEIEEALPEEWHGYGQYAEETLPMPTKYLSAVDVLRFRDNAFKEYFTNPKYIEMVREKFGSKVVEHIGDMLKHEIHRKFI